MNTLTNATGTKRKALHSGKWTHEESAYVKELINEFEAGSLNIEENISLRSFLSKALNCSPKRISKKFEGTSYNGKQLYKRKTSTLTAEEVLGRREKLRDLERKYQESLRVLEMVEASRNSSSAQSQTSASNRHYPTEDPVVAMDGETSLQTAFGLSLADYSRQARIARMKADLALSAMAFNPGTSRISLGHLGNSSQSQILTSRSLPVPSRFAPTLSLQEHLAVGQMLVAASNRTLPCDFTVLPGRTGTDHGQDQPKRGLAFPQNGDLPASKRFRLV